MKHWFSLCQNHCHHVHVKNIWHNSCPFFARNWQWTLIVWSYQVRKIAGTNRITVIEGVISSISTTNINRLTNNMTKHNIFCSCHLVWVILDITILFLFCITFMLSCISIDLAVMLSRLHKNKDLKWILQILQTGGGTTIRSKNAMDEFITIAWSPPGLFVMINAL